MTASEPPSETPIVRLTPSAIYSNELREGAVEAFGDDGAWLVLSVFHYGWRALYDLARSVPPCVTWRDEAPADGLDQEFQIVRDLHIQGLMYAAAEQLASLVDAASAHLRGESLFETYLGNVNLRNRIDRVTELGPENVSQIMGVPSTAAELASDLQFRGLLAPPPSGVVDLAQTPTTDVGGLLVPQSAFDQALVATMLDHINDMADAVYRNLAELRQLVDRPMPAANYGVRPQALREVDNSFRHGLRVLFHRAVPEERLFRAVEVGEASGTHHVDVYLPRPNEDIAFATMACSPDRTTTHVETIRILCLRMGQVARGLVGRFVLNNAGLLTTAVSLSLDGRSDADPPPASDE